MRAAIEYLLSVGVSNIAPAVQSLADQLAEGVAAKGYELLGSRTPETGAGIVSFRRADVESHLIVRRLKSEGIIAAPRKGWVRMAPHFYISPEEIDRVLAAL